jgi:hypothetical protein
MARDPVPASRSAPAGVAFEVDRFEWTASDRLELAGRWVGLRGQRFMRPALTVESAEGNRRMLALLEHKPWAPDAETLWIAAFPWEGEPVALDMAELAVAPSIAVELPPPGAPGGRPRRKPGGRTASRARGAGPELDAARSEAAGLRERLTQARDGARQLGEELERARDRARHEREAALEARDDAEAGLRRLEAERDAARAELAGLRETLARQRSELEGRRDAAVRERDDWKTRAAAARAERDAAITARDAAIAERHDLAPAATATQRPRGDADRLDRLGRSRPAPAPWGGRILALAALAALVVAVAALLHGAL